MRAISIVTPTLHRPDEVAALLANLAEQSVLPEEVIIVDGADVSDRRTELVADAAAGDLPYRCVYLRSDRGTAVQRNRGIDAASGDLIAFVDDDVRLDGEFLEVVAKVFDSDDDGQVGGVVGYRTNQYIPFDDVPRWVWYRRLRLLSTFEPGRYDRKAGYPINANRQPPFSGVREVDFMTTACAVWRREVFDGGLRFDPWYSDFGVLEDANFSLRAGRTWRLLQCGDAHAVELHAMGGRVDARRIGYKSVVNYRYTFEAVEAPLTRAQVARFWRFQAFELLRVSIAYLRTRDRRLRDDLAGRCAGIAAVVLRRDGRPRATERAR